MLSLAGLDFSSVDIESIPQDEKDDLLNQLSSMFKNAEHLAAKMKEKGTLSITHLTFTNDLCLWLVAFLLCLQFYHRLPLTNMELIQVVTD